MRIPGLIPARFLVLIAHLTILATMLWARDPTIKACLPVDYTSQEYDDKDLEFIIGLSLALAFCVVELLGFLVGISMFVHTQNLLSIAAHFSASVALVYYLIDSYGCSEFWWIFGFCSAFPFVMEILVGILVIAFNRRL